MKTYGDRIRYRCRRMLKTSNQDVGHFLDLETKKDGTAAWSTSHWWSEQRRQWCKNLPTAGIQYSDAHLHFQESCSRTREVDDLRSITLQTQVPPRCYPKPSCQSTSSEFTEKQGYGTLVNVGTTTSTRTKISTSRRIWWRNSRGTKLLTVRFSIAKAIGHCS